MNIYVKRSIIFKVLLIELRYLMKSRELKTIHNLIISNYKMVPTGSDGKFLHTFTPETTDTVYTFLANGISMLESGESYNVGYYEDESNNRIVELSATSKIEAVDPIFSYVHAKFMSNLNSKTNKEKNDIRVNHFAKDGYYWGKKYAWRQFGLALPKKVFFDYLEHIGHPSIPCKTINPDLPYQNEDSIAYKEDGIEIAINNLINSAFKATRAYFKSPLYFNGEKKFSIYAPNSQTDKK